MLTWWSSLHMLPHFCSVRYPLGQRLFATAQVFLLKR